MATEKYRYIITEADIKDFLNIDYKEQMTEPSNIDRELKQNYSRLYSFILSNNVFLRQAGQEGLSYKVEKYNKEAATPLDAFYNQFVDDDSVAISWKIEEWKKVQAIQAVYEQENGATAFISGKMPRFCEEAIEILRNSLNLLWRSEFMRG
jgi:hypothetical protein